MTDRPFRHLCPEADLRDAMTEVEFWRHVADNLTGHWEPPYDPDNGPDLDVAISPVPCETCGAHGACAYDAEGRPLIHADTEGADA